MARKFQFRLRHLFYVTIMVAVATILVMRLRGIRIEWESRQSNTYAIASFCWREWDEINQDYWVREYGVWYYNDEFMNTKGWDWGPVSH